MGGQRRRIGGELSELQTACWQQAHGRGNTTGGGRGDGGGGRKGGGSSRFGYSVVGAHTEG